MVEVERKVQFIVMLFGLNMALRVFTKHTKMMAMSLSQQDIKILVYLSDWLIQTTSEEQCESDCDIG